MRGNPQAIYARRPRAAPTRRWFSWITDVIQDRRRLERQRHEVIERLARDQRRAGAQGQYVPERRHRVRAW